MVAVRHGHVCRLTLPRGQRRSIAVKERELEGRRHRCVQNQLHDRRERNGRFDYDRWSLCHNHLVEFDVRYDDSDDAQYRRAVVTADAGDCRVDPGAATANGRDDGDAGTGTGTGNDAEPTTTTTTTTTTTDCSTDRRRSARR